MRQGSGPRQPGGGRQTVGPRGQKLRQAGRQANAQAGGQGPWAAARRRGRQATSTIRRRSRTRARQILVRSAQGGWRPRRFFRWCEPAAGRPAQGAAREIGSPPRAGRDACGDAHDQRSDRDGDGGRGRHAGRPLSRGEIPGAVVLPHPPRHPQRRAAGERQAGRRQGPAGGGTGGPHSAAQARRRRSTSPPRATRRRRHSSSRSRSTRTPTCSSSTSRWGSRCRAAPARRAISTACSG